jgi:hypothetical protein
LSRRSSIASQGLVVVDGAAEALSLEEESTEVRDSNAAASRLSSSTWTKLKFEQ